MKHYIAGLLIIGYILAFSITAAYAWNPVKDYSIIVKDNVEFLIGVAGEDTPKIIYSNSTNTVIIDPFTDQKKTIRGFIPLAACSLGNDIAIAGSYSGRKAILIDYGDRQEILEYSVSSQPRSCDYNNETRLLAVLNTDPVATRILLVVNLENNQAKGYIIPYNLSNPRFVKVSPQGIIIGGDNSWLIMNPENGTYKLVRYQTPNNIWLHFYGATLNKGHILLFGAIENQTSLIKSNYTGFILDPHDQTMYLLKWKKSQTIVHALYPVYDGNLLRMILEVKGKSLQIVDLDPDTLSVKGATRLSILAPYIFDKAGALDDKGWLSIRMYIAENLTRMIYIVESRNTGAIGYNDSETYVLTLIAKPPTIEKTIPYTGTQTQEGSLKLSLSGLELSKFTGNTTIETTDSYIVPAYVDKTIVASSLFAVLTAYLLPIYYAIKRYMNNT